MLLQSWSMLNCYVSAQLMVMLLSYTEQCGNRPQRCRTWYLTCKPAAELEQQKWRSGAFRCPPELDRRASFSLVHLPSVASRAGRHGSSSHEHDSQQLKEESAKFITFTVLSNEWEMGVGALFQQPSLEGWGRMMSLPHINSSLIMENNLQCSNLDGADFLQQMSPSPPPTTQGQDVTLSANWFTSK